MATVNEKMKAIADAIRAHTGGTDALTLDAMAQAIAGIQAGGDVQMKTGTFQPAEEIDVTHPNFYAVSHGLGVVPDMVVVLPNSNYPSTTTGHFVGLSMYRFSKTSGYRAVSVQGKTASSKFVGATSTGAPTDTTFYVGFLGSTTATKIPSASDFRWWAFAWEM